jgi:arsenite methyltransferase
MSEAEEIRTAVGQRFAKIARSPEQEQKFPVGPASAKRLGYDPQEIDALPPSVSESFCGVGNPLGLGGLDAGQTVLDLGSGPGLDSLLAARRVGPTGKVVGVDMCEEMIEKARRNVQALGLKNVVLHTEIEKLPLPDGLVDVVISNGVFNLSTEKPGVLAEAFRALRPDGRLQMADILLHDDVTPERLPTRASGRTESPVPYGGGRSCNCWPKRALSMAESTAGPATTRRLVQKERWSRRGSQCERSGKMGNNMQLC